jgi:hypothetical protein
MLPADIACAKEAKDVMVDCCIGAEIPSLRPYGADDLHRMDKAHIDAIE